MITVTICVVAVIWISGLVIFIVCAHRAPHGVEDEDGFRVVSKEPEKTSARRPETPKPPDSGFETKPPRKDDGSIMPSS